jgi:P4 family phage/plasmid primase-like protien
VSSNERPQFARNINSVRPFRRAVWKYREKGWLGTIPLPPREKHPPPLKTTGRGAAYPTNDQIAEWLEGDIDWASKREFAGVDPKKANIGLHLGPVDIPSGTVGELTGKFEIIGLDVDDYTDGTGDTAKVKTGATQLATLEADLGPLPATWRSSSRTGLSGIRFFLVPAGLAFRGKAAEHIDVIQAVHRFAVVFPSYHPNGGQYVWYRPAENISDLTQDEANALGGDVGDAAALGVRVEGLADLPEAASLPLLPMVAGGSTGESWLDFLTRGRTRDEGVPVDMDIDSREIVKWARRKFVKPPTSGPRVEGRSDWTEGLCSRNARAVELWKRNIESDPSSHDKVTSAHWNLLRNGMEGHSGWGAAVVEIERYIMHDVKVRNKRALFEIKNELWRSKINALRKIKGDVDAMAKDGINLISLACNCFDEEPDPTGDKSKVDGIRIRRTKAGGSIAQTRSGGGDSVAARSSEGGSVAQNNVARKQKTPSALDKSGSESDQNADGVSRSAGLTTGSDSSDSGSGAQEAASTPPVPDPETYERSDDGNAAHWLDLLGIENVHWIPEFMTWIFWSEDEHYWKTDTDGLARRLFRKVRDRQYRYAERLFTTAVTLASNGDDDKAKDARALAKLWKDWANRSGGVTGAGYALEAAKSFGSVTLSASELDADPYLLGVKDAVLQLHPHDAESPWSVREPRRSDLVTHNTGVPVPSLVAETARLKRGGNGSVGGLSAADAREAALWNGYLDYFLPDLEVRHFLQKVLGYGLLGDNRERLFVFFSGPTTTGKGTMLSALSNALGSYIGPTSMRIFQDHKLNPALAEALPRRMVTMDELSGAVTLHADMIKKVTGGLGVKMPAELKGSNKTYERVPAFLSIIATNAAPRVPEADDALRRRLVVIPFHRQMPEAKEDTSIGAEIASAGGAVVLRWLIEGWSMYVRDGLAKTEWPESVKHETDVFHSSLSELGEYITARLERGDGRGTFVPVGTAYSDYVQWCSSNNTPDRERLTAVRFSRALTSQGIKIDSRRVDGKSVRCLVGYELIGAGVKRPTMRKRRAGNPLREV